MTSIIPLKPFGKDLTNQKSIEEVINQGSVHNQSAKTASSIMQPSIVEHPDWYTLAGVVLADGLYVCDIKKTPWDPVVRTQQEMIECSKANESHADRFIVASLAEIHATHYFLYMQKNKTVIQAKLELALNRMYLPGLLTLSQTKESFGFNLETVAHNVGLASQYHAIGEIPKTIFLPTVSPNSSEILLGYTAQFPAPSSQIVDDVYQKMFNAGLEVNGSYPIGYDRLAEGEPNKFPISLCLQDSRFKIVARSNPNTKLHALGVRFRSASNAT